MKLSSHILVSTVAFLPTVSAWGALGHMASAYVATHFVSNATQVDLQYLLNSDEPDYLAKVASWADSVRYTKWGRFTKNFHFIDAHDAPPKSCGVSYQRDCKEDGCVISALSNYTTQAVDASLSTWRRAQAAKFVIHFIGDLHQPLHNEDVARGGNGIHVLWNGREYNLHHVWDSSIAEKSLGGLRGKPDVLAKTWAERLIKEIEHGKFADESDSWLKGLNFADSNATAMIWAQEANAFICSHVLPDGPEAIVGQELSGQYYENAAPVIERQVARAGLRMAAWLDHITKEYLSNKATFRASDSTADDSGMFIDDEL